MAEIEVLAADQEKINKFGNLNTQCTALKLELEALQKKKEQYSNANDDLEEAQMMETIENAPYLIGSVFVELPLDKAIDELTKDREEIDKKVASLQEQISAKESEMDILRTTLYAKFGRENINLG